MGTVASALLAILMSLASAGLMTYWSARVWLLREGITPRVNAILDRDIERGQQLWFLLRGLFWTSVW
jgi:hypothetical protein